MPRRKRRLRISSFAYLNIAQFCGALIDNLFKLVIIFLVVHLRGPQVINEVMITTGAIFVVPYLLLSVPAGTFSDRHSKRNILFFIKVCEVVIMLFGVVAFWLESIWMSYLVLFLMSTAAAIFSPAKYGIVPELVERERIAQANGILTGLTVIATILGSFLASVLTQLTESNFPLIGGFGVLIALVGLAGAFGIGYTPPSGATQPMSMRLLREVIRVLKRSRGENYLLAAIIGSALFYTIGSYMQLNILPYSIESLGLSEVEGNYIFGIAAIGIAMGAYTSGRLSGRDVEIGLSPLAGIGIFIFMALLYVFQHSLWAVMILFLILGAMGGMFLVPCDAYIQVASPDQERGENVAAANILSFVGIALGVVLLFFFAQVMHLTAAEGFVGMAIITVIIAIILMWRLSDSMVRLVSRFRFTKGHRLVVSSRELVSHDKPTVFLCEVPHWTFGVAVMVILQQRYMKFAVERPATLSVKERWLCRIGKIVFFDGLPTEDEAVIRRWLKRGFSVTVIPSPSSLDAHREALKAACQALAATVEGQALIAHLAHTPDHEPVNVSLSA